MGKDVENPMKHFILLLIFVVTSGAAFAGVSYRFEMEASGLASRGMAGSVDAEPGSMRVNIDRGDGMMYADHSFAITSGKAKRLTVVDPSAKTFYEIALDDLAGGGGSMLHQLKEMMNLTVTRPRVDVRDLGDGGTIEGYPTRHRLVETSYRVTVAAAALSVAFTTTVESWTTDKIPSDYASVLAQNELRSGIPEVDKLIEAQAGQAAGFPLRQISTTKIARSDSTITLKTVTTIRDVRSRAINPSVFAVPPGYTRVDNPIEKAMKAIGK